MIASTATGQQAKHSSSIVGALPAGVVCAGVYVGCRALKQSNKADTFAKTIKNAAKDYTQYNRKTLASFCGDMLGMKNFQNWLNKVSNKKMFAFMLGADIITSALTISFLKDFVKGFGKDK